MDSFDPKTLDRYLAGEATPEDRARLDAWLHENPARHRALRALEDLQANALQPPVGFDTERFVAKIDRYAVRASNQQARQVVTHATRPLFFRPFVYAGGVSAALLAITFLVEPITNALRNERRTPIATQVAQTNTGQRANLRLADGTIVHLSVASTLRYPNDFGKNSRTVELNGEAYFEVSQQLGTPFIVRTKDASTRVLGTAFGVRRYADDDHVNVTVVSGKVSVIAASTTERIVTAGQSARANSQTIDVTSAIPGTFAWLNGRMVFNDTPLPEVLREIERWYGVRFVSNDSTLAKKIVHTELGTQSLDDVLKILTITLDVRMQRNGSTITIHSR